MKNKPSQGQVLNAIAILMNNADWKAFPASTLQKVIDNPKGAGREFSAFLSNGGRVGISAPEIITIDRTRPFDPVTFIDAGWSIVEQDERSIKLGEVDLMKVDLETMLKDGEKSVIGFGKLKRLVATGNIRLDAKVFQTLWENKHLIPASWKEFVKDDNVYIFFDGTILQDCQNEQYVLCLSWDGLEWRWHYSLLSCNWNANRPSAVLRVD